MLVTHFNKFNKKALYLIKYSNEIAAMFGAGDNCWVPDERSLVGLNSMVNNWS